MKTKSKLKKRFIHHDQWVEIKRREGKTITLRYPSNNEFEKLRLKLDPPPDMIYRRLNFSQGVPPEYSWTEPDVNAKQYGGLFLQRILLVEWPSILIAEQASGSDLVIPARFAQPRPEELGPCPCDTCTEERDKGLPSRFTGKVA